MKPLFVILVAGTIGAAGAPAPVWAQGTPPAAAPTAPAPTRDQGLIDAAGHFETMTEQAYAKTRDELAAMFGQARSAADGVAGTLSAEGRAALTAALRAVEEALARNAPSEVALASIEAYRALVNEISAAHPVPREVSLLDYAGFKVEALLKAGTVDWAEIERTISFADTTWSPLAPRVRDATLRTDFAASLASLRQAAAARNTAGTAAAARRVLDLVDNLEKAFMTN